MFGQIITFFKDKLTQPEAYERPQKRGSGDILQLFDNYFGFHVSFVRNRDFRTEMAISLMTLSLKAKKLALRRLKEPHSESTKSEYIRAIRDYHHAAEIAYSVHTDFEHIPLHWSRYPEFFEQWGKMNKPRRQNPIPIAEEALLIDSCT